MTEPVVCPYCREAIKPDAIKCRHCGEFLDGRNKSIDTRWNPGIAALLSLVMVGAGQLYKGDARRAVALFVIFALCILASFIAGSGDSLPAALVGLMAALLALVVGGFGVYDAYTNQDTSAGFRLGKATHAPHE